MERMLQSIPEFQSISGHFPPRPRVCDRYCDHTRPTLLSRAAAVASVSFSSESNVAPDAHHRGRCRETQSPWCNGGIILGPDTRQGHRESAEMDDARGSGVVCGCDSAVGRLDGCQVASDLQQEARANPETKFQRPLVPGCRGPDYFVYVGIMRCGWTWSHVLRLYVLLRTAPWAGCVLSGDCSSVQNPRWRPTGWPLTLLYDTVRRVRARPGWFLGMNGWSRV